jgi:hypothetical protein
LGDVFVPLGEGLWRYVSVAKSYVELGSCHLAEEQSGLKYGQGLLTEARYDVHYGSVHFSYLIVPVSFHVDADPQVGDRE